MTGAVISNNYVLTAAPGLTPDHPVIGWRNIVTSANVAVSSEVAPNLGRNVANPATFLKWQAAINSPPADDYLMINTGTADPIDYFAIAGHNLASAQCQVSIEYFDGNSPGTFVQATSPVILANDGPALFRFAAVTTSIIRIRMQPGVAAPSIAVVYVGKLLVLERRVYAGYTPITQGRIWTATNGMSEAGQFLGRIVLSEFVKTKLPLQLLSPAWFRANLDPFLEAAKQTPFFFAWRPQTYPAEVGYCWLTNMPAPAPAPPSNLIALELEMTGVT